MVTRKPPILLSIREYLTSTRSILLSIPPSIDHIIEWLPANRQYIRQNVNTTTRKHSHSIDNIIECGRSPNVRTINNEPDLTMNNKNNANQEQTCLHLTEEVEGKENIQGMVYEMKGLGNDNGAREKAFGKSSAVIMLLANSDCRIAQML